MFQKLGFQQKVKQPYVQNTILIKPSLVFAYLHQAAPRPTGYNIFDKSRFACHLSIVVNRIFSVSASLYLMYLTKFFGNT